jgi:hypothetical protein
MDLHENYPTAAILTFTPDLGHDRFWHIPPAPERRPYFVATMFDLLGDWAACFVWKHSGSWPSSANPERINDVVELRILSGLGPCRSVLPKLSNLGERILTVSSP